MIVERALARDEALRALDAFEAPAASERREVLWLAPQDDLEAESDRWVQLRAGVLAEVDGVNRHWLTGELRADILDGWGYDLHRFVGGAEIAATRVGGEGAPRQEWVWSQASMVRYNSRLPLVVYLPRALRLSYRLLAPQGDYQLLDSSD